MLRIARSDDYDAVKNIKKEIHNLHVQNEPLFYRNVEDLLTLDTLLSEIAKEKYYVFEKDGVVVGYILINIMTIKDNPMIFDQKILLIEDFGVRSSLKRTGIGRKMFEKIEEIAVKINANSIELNVWDFNNAAKYFYKAMGMRNTRIRMFKSLK